MTSRTKGVAILEFRAVQRQGEETGSKEKKRGSDDRVASIEGGRNARNRAGGSARMALAREHGSVIGNHKTTTLVKRRSFVSLRKKNAPLKGEVHPK